MTPSGKTGTPRGRDSLLLPLVVVVLATAVFGAGSLVLPMGRDQGFSVYLAEQALNGKALYRDLLVDLPPMAVVVNMLALILFGRTMTAIRILELLMAASTAAFVFGFFWRAWRRKWLAVLAGILYPFLYFQFNYWHTAQPDGFANLPVAAAMLVVLAAVERPTAWRWLAAGLLAAFALLFRPTLWLFLPGLAALACLRPGGRNWRGALWFGTGVLATGLGTLFVAAVSGVLPDFLRTAFTVPSPDGGTGFGYSGIADRVVPTLATYLLEPDFCIGAVLGGIGVVLALVRLLRPDTGDSGRQPYLLLALWVAAALFSVFIQGSFHLNHYAPLLPALALSTVLALSGIFGPAWRRLSGPLPRWLLAGAVGLVLFATSVLPMRISDLAQVATGALPQPDYYMSKRFNSGAFSIAQDLGAAEYLSVNSAPADRVFVWGNEPLIAFLARRNGATRFAGNRVMRGNWPRGPLARQLTQELSSSPPEWFLVWHGDVSRWGGGGFLDSYNALLEGPALVRFVMDNYEMEARMGRFDVLRRSNSERTAPSTVGGAALEQDLQEALAFCAGSAPGRYRSVLWPGGDLDRLARETGLGERLLSYRTLNHLIWQGSEIAARMPALSIWIAGDDRAFADLAPWRFQDDGDHFVSDDYRFTLIHTGANRLVYVYEVAEATGRETVQQGE